MGTVSDSMTVLHSRTLRLAKHLRTDGGADGYDRAKHLDAFTVQVAGLDEVLLLLGRLVPTPSCCVVRGELVHGPRAKGVRRLLHLDKKTGELPTFRDVPRRWLALDLDGLPLPSHVPHTDLAGCMGVAISTLPGAFGDAACIVQASARHGLLPGLRLRLWFWLDRPTWGHELKRWLKGVGCDMSVFGAVQPIYTAAPTLAPGVFDLLPQRVLLVPGRPVVSVPSPDALAPPPPPPAPDRPKGKYTVNNGGTHPYVRKAVESGVQRIATSAVSGRHPTIVAETSRLARFVESGLLTTGQIKQLVTAAAKMAGKDDDDEIEKAIEWGLDHPWTAGPMPTVSADGR